MRWVSIRLDRARSADRRVGKGRGTKGEGKPRRRRRRISAMPWSSFITSRKRVLFAASGMASNFVTVRASSHSGLRKLHKDIRVASPGWYITCTVSIQLASRSRMCPSPLQSLLRKMRKMLRKTRNTRITCTSTQHQVSQAYHLFSVQRQALHLFQRVAELKCFSQMLHLPTL